MTQTTLGPYRKIILLGGGQLLRMLSKWAPENGYTVKVITSPRHAVEQLDGMALDAYFTSSGVDCLVTEKIDTPEVRDFIGDTRETIFLSLGAAWLFKPDAIASIFNNALFNLHGSRLPQNRGGGGFSWQIMTANRFGFCALHVIDGGIDTGDIIASEEFLYPASCRIPEDYDRVFVGKYFTFTTSLLAEIMGKAKAVKPVAQSEYLSIYWPRLSTATQSWIDWSHEPQHVERFICAFDSPYAGAQTYLDGKLVHLKGVSLNLQDGVFHPYQAGLVYRTNSKWLCVALNGAALIVEDVLDESGASILFTVHVGDRFCTPAEKLDAGRQRVIFTPSGMKTRG